MKGVFHTGITVSSLDRSVPFYRDTLGLKMTVPPTDVFEGDELAQGLGVPGAQLRLAIFQVGDGQVELLEYKNPASSVDRPMPANTLGAMHLALHVENMGAKVKELTAKGVTFLSPPTVIADGPLNGWTWVYFKDPDGITLELIEYKPPKA